jgi:hypothetical protein
MNIKFLIYIVHSLLVVQQFILFSTSLFCSTYFLLPIFFYSRSHSYFPHSLVPFFSPVSFLSTSFLIFSLLYASMLCPPRTCFFFFTSISVPLFLITSFFPSSPYVLPLFLPSCFLIPQMIAECWWQDQEPYRVLQHLSPLSVPKRLPWSAIALETCRPSVSSDNEISIITS